MNQRAPLFECLEPRQLFSSIDLNGAIDPDLFAAEKAAWLPLDPATFSQPVRRDAPVIPNVKRTYSGSFSLGTGLSGTFRLTIRKEENRGTYSALRGSLQIVTNQFGTLNADMTYGKIRDNYRVNATLVSTTPPATVTVFGKASASGSQIKGQIDVTGSVAFSTTYIVTKVVH